MWYPPAVVPVGTICAFAGNVPKSAQGSNQTWSTLPCASPSAQADTDPVPPVIQIEALGWMLCDGRSLLVSAFHDLFAVLGYTYGGQGEAFQIPDCRGLFLRGVDHGSGLDPDSAQRMPPPQGSAAGPGSLQCDALQRHKHDYDYVTGGAVSVEGPAAAQPPVQTAQTSNPVPPARITSETRPKNIAVNYIIRVR